VLLFTPPLALVVNVVALFTDQRKHYGIAGLVISGLTCSLYLAMVLLPMLSAR
jgi:uncharacterized membrane-anchored protein